MFGTSKRTPRARPYGASQDECFAELLANVMRAEKSIPVKNKACDSVAEGKTELPGTGEHTQWGFAWRRNEYNRAEGIQTAVLVPRTPIH